MDKPWPTIRRIITRSHFAGRSAVLNTDNDLETQPGPERIDRFFTNNPLGFSQPRNVNFLNETGMQYIGHVPLTHAPGIPVPRKMIDDSVFIPALYVGNPDNG